MDYRNLLGWGYVSFGCGEREREMLCEDELVGFGSGEGG